MQGFEGNANAVLVAIVECNRAIEIEWITIRELDAAIPESPDANFRTLEVTHDSNGASAFFSGNAKCGGAAAMIRLFAM